MTGELFIYHRTTMIVYVEVISYSLILEKNAHSQKQWKQFVIGVRRDVQT